MKTYREPHEPSDLAKLAALVESFREGRTISPIVVIGENALTGSHRIAAHRIAWRRWSDGVDGWDEAAEPVLNTVECTDDEYVAAITQADLEPGTQDYNALADAIYAATDNDELKAALEDQIGY